MSEQTVNKTLELILNGLASGGPLAVLAIEALTEIKALSKLSDDEINDIWIATGEANKVEIAKRRLELSQGDIGHDEEKLPKGTFLNEVADESGSE
jgi:hypothetical protein